MEEERIDGHRLNRKKMAKKYFLNKKKRRELGTDYGLGMISN